MHTPPGERWSWKNRSRQAAACSSMWVIKDPHQIRSNRLETDNRVKSKFEMTVLTKNARLQKSNAPGSMSEAVISATGNFAFKNLRTLPYPQAKSRMVRT